MSGLELGLVLVLVLGLGLVVLHAFEELLIPLDHLVRVRVRVRVLFHSTTYSVVGGRRE